MVLGKKTVKNPIFFWLITIFVMLNLADGITALFILEGEANPLYLLTGSLWPLYVFKILLIGVLIMVYRQSSNKEMSEFTYYVYMLVLCMSVLLLGVGVYSNVKGILNPELLAYAAAVPAAAKAKAYGKTVSFIYILPTALSLLASLFS